MNNETRDGRQAAPVQPRKAWEAPRVIDLPRLTELTLQSEAIPGGGDTGGGGSTVVT